MSEIISNVTDASSGVLAKFAKVLKYIAISYVLSLILIVALSAAICYTDIPESFSSPGVKIITFLGVFVSSFPSARSASGRGWLVGGMTGALNIILLLLIGMITVKTEAFTMANGTQILCGFAVGALGGVFGINSKKN